MTDFIVLLIIAAAAGAAIWYIRRAKKSGRACIGCPGSGCGGSCAGCHHRD